MKMRKTIYFLILLSVITTSCSDFLEIKDESAINTSIWDNEESAKLYLNYIYSSYLTPFGGNTDINSSTLTSLSDEVNTTPSGVLIGTLSAGSVSTYSTTTYNSIRYINIGIDNARNSSLDSNAKKRTLGQLYFFRAWFHWRMINLYGGVPYVRDYTTTVANDTTDTVANKPRTKTSLCMEYLKQDLDSAIANLPSLWSTSEYARITRAAAAAFKGRVLLFYASPQFNPDNNIDRWKEAYEANIAARDLCLEDGYSLMDISTTATDECPYGYDQNIIFQTKISAGNKEALLVTPYYTDIKVHGYEYSVCPNELTLNTNDPSNCPSWDLVISFPMKDGSVAFKNSSSNAQTRTFIGNGSDITKFYLNRDPRFYSTIAFNGCYYTLGGSSRRQWTYNCSTKSGGTYYSDNNTTSSSHISSSGFYCRKMVNPNLAVANFQKSYTDWIELRYAEVLLNLAECAFEYQGDNSEVGFDCLKQIRARAGIDAGTDGTYGLAGSITTGLTPIELVINERKVEMAFEGKRFWDLRRRNMFTTDLGSYIFKLNGWKRSGSGYTFTLKTASDTAIFLYSAKRDTVAFKNLYKYFKMTAKSTGPLVKSMAYICVADSTALSNTTAGNYNFFDVPTTIIERSPAVEQTLGWQNGVFNPFR
jgi:starch-binding outer membrane protein, SusD/RagB family